MQHNTENTTTPPALIPSASEPRASTEAPALVLVWSRSRPDRIGEFAPLGGSNAWTFGRGRDDDGAHPRIQFLRERPGAIIETDTFKDDSLSRLQFRLLEGPIGFEIVHYGSQTTLFVDRTQVRERAILREGSVIAIRDQLGDLHVFLYTTRPNVLPRIAYPSSFAFGEMDAHGILGESAAAWKLRAQIAIASQSSLHALVHGESGTGKELAAQAIHALSRRAGRPLLSRNAATFPTELIDPELFGNLRNFPNPGMPERLGLFGEADGGAIFLDEIGELPRALQSRLLRVLDAGEYTRIGEAIARRANVRVIGATNRDLHDIKHDVLARFGERVELPSLASRREDIPLLVRDFVVAYAKDMPDVAGRFVALGPDGREHASISSDLITILVRREYPGNVRDLRRLVWEAIKASEGTILVAPKHWAEATEAPRPGLRKAEPSPDPNAPSADELIGGIIVRKPATPDKASVVRALAASAGNITRAARELGLRDRNQLYRLMMKYEIKIEDDSGTAR